MEESVKRVLFINSEMVPYLGSSSISEYCRHLCQGVQEKRIEIRSFLPRYGLINERKNQLHEVIRLSGMNIIIGDVDRPLIIKVASLPAGRMQVYFIDNEDYFRRKSLYCDASGVNFADNGDRAVFFARGVLETVKKLRWSPDIIHCSGWISHVVPLFLKKCYKDDPIFSSSKIVLSLFQDTPQQDFPDSIVDSLCFPGITPEDLTQIVGEKNGTGLAKLAIEYSDGIIVPKDINPDAALMEFAKEHGKKILEDTVSSSDALYESYRNFYKSLK